MPSISLLCHLYYQDSLDMLLPYLKNLHGYNTRFFFNVCSDAGYHTEVVKKLRATFQDAIITCSPNAGKDIGGKLVLLDTYLKLGGESDYLVLIHDKHSPQTVTGAAWRKKLLAILEKENIIKILRLFSSKAVVGLVGSEDQITNEYDAKTKTYKCSSHAELELLRAQYNIHTDVPAFIGGTMFWTRAAIYRDFFLQYSPLQIRSTLETGNILDYEKGSFSHAWERMFSWIVLNRGFKIAGI